MKESPHGASVVPTVAVTIAMAALSVGGLGTSMPWNAAPQSGGAGTPETQKRLGAGVRSEYGVGGDAGRVVVGEPGEQPRTDNRQQCAETEPVAPEALHVAPSLVPLTPVGV